MKNICSIIGLTIAFSAMPLSASTNHTKYVGGVSNYLLKNYNVIEKQISTQVKIMESKKYRPKLIANINKQSDRVDDFIIHKALEKLGYSIKGTISTVAKASGVRKLSVVRDGFTRPFVYDLTYQCLMPHTPATVINFLTLDNMSDTELNTAKTAFERISPLYGSLLDVMDRNGLIYRNSNGGNADGGSYNTGGFEYGDCSPKDVTRSHHTSLEWYPHFIRTAAKENTSFVGGFGRFSDNSRQVRKKLSGRKISLAQVQYLKSVFTFMGDHPSYYGDVGTWIEELANLEKELLNSDDFTDLNSVSGDEESDKAKEFSLDDLKL